jgi:hypothetical protein
MKINKKGQAVFIGFLFFVCSIIAFFLCLPTMIQFIQYGISQTDNALAKLVMALFPIFIFIMICFISIKLMRSE